MAAGQGRSPFIEVHRLSNLQPGVCHLICMCRQSYHQMSSVDCGGAAHRQNDADDWFHVWLQEEHHCAAVVPLLWAPAGEHLHSGAEHPRRQPRQPEEVFGGRTSGLFYQHHIGCFSLFEAPSPQMKCTCVYDSTIIYLLLLLIIIYNKGAAKNNVTLVVNNSIRNKLNSIRFSLQWAQRLIWTDGTWTVFLSFAFFPFLPPTLVFVSAVLCFCLCCNKNILWSLFFFFSFFSLTVLLSGCRSVPQHHLLQPAVREHQRDTRGGVPSGASSRHPWCHPQDAPWLWHPGWGAGPQAVRFAALLWLLFEYGLLFRSQ